jgi:hypothetical protein
MKTPGIRIVLLAIALLFCAIPGNAVKAIDIEEELRLLERGKPLPKHISYAQYRVAVFTYEDPYGTGLGNDLAALVGNHILLNSGVGSLGVLRPKGQLSPTTRSSLSYFDKVDQLIEAQEVSLAVWGMIRRVGENLVIDTYAQIPRKISEQYFVWQLKLPERMGGATLKAHLRPNRIHLQKLSIPSRSPDRIIDAARQLELLRKEPDSAAEVIGHLPQGEVYWVTERRGDWAQFMTRSGLTGWATTAGNCISECRLLLNAAQYAANLLTYMRYRHKTPPAMAGLSTDTLAVTEQIRALEALNGDLHQILGTSLALAERWTGPRRLTGQDPTTKIERGSGVPPGGAAFANLRMLALIAYKLQVAFQRQIKDAGSSGGPRLIYEKLRIPTAAVESMAFDLAEASLLDPENIDVLNNLAVVFKYAGRTKRSKLARRLMSIILGGVVTTEVILAAGEPPQQVTVSRAEATFKDASLNRDEALKNLSLTEAEDALLLAEKTASQLALLSQNNRLMAEIEKARMTADIAGQTSSVVRDLVALPRQAAPTALAFAGRGTGNIGITAKSLDVAEELCKLVWSFDRMALERDDAELKQTVRKASQSIRSTIREVANTADYIAATSLNAVEVGLASELKVRSQNIQYCIIDEEEEPPCEGPDCDPCASCV